MNAVISGRAGVALLVDGGTISSVHACDPHKHVVRRAEDFWHLFGNAGDFEVVVDAAPTAIEQRLLAATNGQQVLDLTLILFDAELSEPTRSAAAEELDGLLAQVEAAERAECYLFAHPLPEQADLAGALAGCASRFPRCEVFLRRIEKFQPAIREVRAAFESALYLLPANPLSLDDLRSVAAQRGLFRDFVIAVAGEQPIAPVVFRSLQTLQHESFPDARQLLSRWIEQVDSPSRPGMRLEREESPEQSRQLDLWASPKTSSISGNVETKRKTVLNVAQAFFDRGPDWVTFFREVLGVNGVVRTVFADRKSLLEFELSPEYDHIQHMLTRLREEVTLIQPETPVREITIHLPLSLHEELVAEADAFRTSMNNLCISKLIQIIDEEFIPAAKTDIVVESE